jgi:hypothetical protein
MDIRERESIFELFEDMVATRIQISRLSRSLKRKTSNLSGTFTELDSALDHVITSTNKVEAIIDRLLDDENWTSEPTSFTADETKRLQNLNHVMNDISEFMHRTADAIRPAMHAKTADNRDPMYDYEIEAELDYALRNDDPEYDEDSDNYLSSRSESLRFDRNEDDLNDDWRGSLTPEAFLSEPLSWLLHSLTEHSYGPEGPRVRLKNCLRIGRILLDIQVWHQYVFDINEGKWIKRWQRPEGIPDYVDESLPNLESSQIGENNAARD